MAQITARQPFGQRIHWDDFIKPWLIRIIFAIIGIGIGYYILAPLQASKGEANLPKTFLSLPTGSVQIIQDDGFGSLLPVRIADTSTNRTAAFQDVGPLVLNNSFILFAQARESTTTQTYTLKNVRVPLEMAVINAEGNVIEIKTAPLGTERVAITEKHRWVLAAKPGTFEPYGIGVGTKINPESVRKINF